MRLWFSHFAWLRHSLAQLLAASLYFPLVLIHFHDDGLRKIKARTTGKSEHHLI